MLKTTSSYISCICVRACVRACVCVRVCACVVVAAAVIVIAAARLSLFNTQPLIGWAAFPSLLEGQSGVPHPVWN